MRYPIELEIHRDFIPQTPHLPQCLAFHHSDTDWPNELSLSQIRQLISLYFRYFHPHYPIIPNEHAFYARDLSRALQTGFEPTPDTALFWLVLALGSIAAYENGHIEWAMRGIDTRDANAGLGFYNLAARIYRSVPVTNWKGVQCCLLMGYVLLVDILLSETTPTK